MKTFICLVALLGVASALPSSFKVAGGPADVRGAWAGPGDDSYSAGVQGKKGYAYGYHSSTGAYTTEIGTYLSHECTGKGSYRALVKSVTTDAQGKETKTVLCEVGQVNLQTGIYKWASSSRKCPTVLTETLTRAGSFDIPCSYACA